MVQGVGFRYFYPSRRGKIAHSWFRQNLRDGRVEVFAMGAPQQHAEFRAMLERGPRFSSISGFRKRPPHWTAVCGRIRHQSEYLNDMT